MKNKPVPQTSYKPLKEISLLTKVSKTDTSTVYPELTFQLPIHCFLNATVAKDVTNSEVLSYVLCHITLLTVKNC